MKAFASLRGRIFLTSAALAVLVTGVAIYVVSVRVTRETEHELERQLEATGALVDQLRTTRTQSLTVMAQLVADLPKLKAAVATNDPPTVQDVAAGYQQQLGSSLLVVTGASGRRLASVGPSVPGSAVRAVLDSAIVAALANRVAVDLTRQPGGLLQVITVPIALGLDHPQVLGALSVGFQFDDALAQQLKVATGSDIAFGVDGEIVASTLPATSRGALAPLLASAGVSRARLGDQEVIVRQLALAPDLGGAAPTARVLVIRSRTEQLRFLQSIRAGLAATALIAVILAVALSFAVARTITRPLAAITDVMRDVARTGDLTQKISLRSGSGWDDEDAQLLARTFNGLADSIVRFQREASQRDRLSSLGRLSTVIAHEIRNPLMIIKASLHGLTRADATPADLHEAVADINEEVARLNGVVNDVLDFARPMTFDCESTDLNALCRSAAAASAAAGAGVPVQLELDPSLTPVSTDGGRLRLALVNMLVNAQHAVAEQAAAGSGPLITLRTVAGGDRLTIVIADRGVGIDPANLGHVFDPFFTTRRGGTGIGLAVARRIVEGLGGTIAIDSAPGHGTTLGIVLPALHDLHTAAT